MTDNVELNINTFCPLDCYVPTFEDAKESSEGKANQRHAALIPDIASSLDTP